MNRRIERRLADAEHRTAPARKEFHVIIFEGGLYGGEPRFAEAGALRWVRSPTEPFETFRAKVQKEAISAGEARVFFGGLPGPGFSASDFDSWKDEPDGACGVSDKE